MYSSSQNKLRAGVLERLLSEQRRANPGFENESAPLADSIRDSFDAAAGAVMNYSTEEKKKKEVNDG